MKTLLEESSQSCTSQTGTPRTVEFTGELLPMRSGKQPDRCWPLIGHEKTDKHLNMSWNWFVKRIIPEALSPVLENFCRRFS